MQTTIQTAVSFSGVTLHAGATVTLCVRPAAADTGIVFERLDLALPRVARRVPVGVDALIGLRRKARDATGGNGSNRASADSGPLSLPADAGHRT